jgi:hypothetical protein
VANVGESLWIEMIKKEVVDVRTSVEDSKVWVLKLEKEMGDETDLFNPYDERRDEMDDDGHHRIFIRSIRRCSHDTDTEDDDEDHAIDNKLHATAGFLSIVVVECPLL